MLRHLCITLVLLLAASSTAAHPDEPSFEKEIQPFLNTNCVRCHNEEKRVGEFRLDALAKDVGQQDAPRWAEVMGRISSGEMQPADVKNRPTADQSAFVVEWLATRIREGEAVRMARRTIDSRATNM